MEEVFKANGVVRTSSRSSATRSAEKRPDPEPHPGTHPATPGRPAAPQPEPEPPREPLLPDSANSVSGAAYAHAGSRSATTPSEWFDGTEDWPIPALRLDPDGFIEGVIYTPETRPPFDPTSMQRWIAPSGSASPSGGPKRATSPSRPRSPSGTSWCPRIGCCLTRRAVGRDRPREPRPVRMVWSAAR